MLQFADITATSSTNFQVDWVAIAGIIGTLLGTALGAYVTWRIQKSQIEHEDKVRFHDRRLAIYADFVEASNNAIAKHQAGMDSIEDVRIVARLWESFRLIASEEVVNAAIPVHSAIVEVNSKTIANLAEFLNTFNVHIVKLLAVMRAEIGTDSKHQ